MNPSPSPDDGCAVVGCLFISIPVGILLWAGLGWCLIEVIKLVVT